MSQARDFADSFSAVSTGRRNMLINGAMQVAQRGTSSTSSGYHTCDRWFVNYQAFDELAITQSQSTTSPSGFSNSLKVEVTTAETALASNELMYIRYHIEAQDLQHLNFGSSDAKSLTLSFWVRSSLTGKYSVLFYEDDATRSNTPSFNISTADTWEYKTITVEGDTGGTINNDNGAGLSLYITLASGTDFAGTPHSGWGAYSGTDDFSHSDNVDFSAQTGTFYITGVQLEVGNSASPFEHRSYAEELALCQRYYFETDKITGQVANSTNAIFQGLFPTEMRASPTVSGGPYTIWQMTVAGSKAQSSANNNADSNQNNNQSFNVQCGNFSGLSQYYPVGIASGGPIKFSSEL